MLTGVLFVATAAIAQQAGSAGAIQQALYQRFSAKGLAVLAISDEDQAKVRPFIAAQKYRYPILLDPGGNINRRFLIQGIPKSLVYDHTGKLVAQSPDMRTMSQFLDMLRRTGLDE